MSKTGRKKTLDDGRYCSIYIDRALLEQLQAEAKRRKVSRNALIIALLKQGIRDE